MKQTYNNIDKYELICLNILKDIEEEYNNKIINKAKMYDEDICKFVEDYLGVKLTRYQKIILKNKQFINNTVYPIVYPRHHNINYIKFIQEQMLKYVLHNNSKIGD